MRKLILVSLCILLSAAALNAQKKGDLYVGASAGAAYSDASGIAWGASLSTEVGYFVFKNWKVALSAGYSYQQQGVESSAVGPMIGVHIVLLGPSISYYVKLAKGLYYTPEAGVYYAWGGARQLHSEYNFHTSLRGFQLAASLFALEFRPTDKLGISLSLAGFTGGQVVSPQEDGAYRMGTQNVDILLNSVGSVGLRFYF